MPLSIFSTLSWMAVPAGVWRAALVRMLVRTCTMRMKSMETGGTVLVDADRQGMILRLAAKASATTETRSKMSVVRLLQLEHARFQPAHAEKVLHDGVQPVGGREGFREEQPPGLGGRPPWSGP